MSESSLQTVTRLLQRMGDGDSEAADALLPLVYEELRAAASAAMSSERKGHTLQATALVHEAWMRLGCGVGGSWQDRGHFLRVASRAMRRVLVDHVRARNAAKRGGHHEREPLDDAVAAFETDRLDLLALDEALARLAQENERLARVVELRFFGGLTAGEAAAALGLTPHQIHYSWELARAWLYRRLKNEP